MCSVSEKSEISLKINTPFYFKVNKCNWVKPRITLQLLRSTSKNKRETKIKVISVITIETKYIASEKTNYMMFMLEIDTAYSIYGWNK